MSFSTKKIRFVADFSFVPGSLVKATCVGLKTFFSAEISLNVARSLLGCFLLHSLLTTSPKGLFSANYKEEGKNKNIYKLFKVTIANH